MAHATLQSDAITLPSLNILQSVAHVIAIIFQMTHWKHGVLGLHPKFYSPHAENRSVETVLAAT